MDEYRVTQDLAGCSAPEVDLNPRPQVYDVARR